PSSCPTVSSRPSGSKRSSAPSSTIPSGARQWRRQCGRTPISMPPTASPNWSRTPRMTEVLDLSRPRRIHIVGGGGAGMSAIGSVLAAMGHSVSGSDLKDSGSLHRLRAGGIDVHVGHDPALVDGADLVAVSTAIPERNPEVTAAHEHGVTVARRA